MSVQYSISGSAGFAVALERVEMRGNRVARGQRSGGTPRDAEGACRAARGARSEGRMERAHAGWISMIDLHQAVVMQRDPLGPDKSESAAVHAGGVDRSRPGRADDSRDDGGRRGYWWWAIRGSRAGRQSSTERGRRQCREATVGSR